jgi:hypothetical protein
VLRAERGALTVMHPTAVPVGASAAGEVKPPGVGEPGRPTGMPSWSPSPGSRRSPFQQRACRHRSSPGGRGHRRLAVISPLERSTDPAEVALLVTGERLSTAEVRTPNRAQISPAATRPAVLAQPGLQ